MIQIAGHKTKYLVCTTMSKWRAELGKISFLSAVAEVHISTSCPYTPSVIFDAGCLQDIVDFLKDQTQQWRDSL